jgi:pre-peptidase
MKIRRQNPCLAHLARRGFLTALLFALGWNGIAAAAEKPRTTPTVSSNVSLVPVVGAAKEELIRALGESRGLLTPQSPAHHDCTGGTPHVQGVACGSTTNDQLTTTGSCTLSDGSYVDFYAFDGTAGQQVTITMSAAYDTFLFLLDPMSATATTDHGGGGGNTSRIVYTLTATGTWFIAANAFQPGVVGNYSLDLTCTAGPAPGACAANATTLCLNNNRFRVQATFATPQGQTGNATAIPQTVDTGLFWFFSASNIEAVVKVVNACGFAGGPRYWVFAGGLTNVEVVLTVTDTQTGSVKTYTNPQGTPFAPIQDTNAFATCP